MSFATTPKVCPDCDSVLGPRARKCGCGWKAPAPSAPIGSPGSAFTASADDLNRFRCDWESNGVRCRYPGGCSRATLGSGSKFCFGHLACADTADGGLGQRIVDESIEKIPDHCDYSALGMMAAARKAAEDRAKCPPPTWADNALAAMRAGDRHLKPVGALAAASYPAAANWTARHELDAEARAERDAITGEGVEA
jgi:hypothetical protein